MTPEDMKDTKIDSKVNIRKCGKGYLIEVRDQYYTEYDLAVTRDELEQIALYAQAILKTQTPTEKMGESVTLTGTGKYTGRCCCGGKYPNLKIHTLESCYTEL